MALKDRVEKYVTDQSEKEKFLNLLDLAEALTGKEDPRVKSLRKVIEVETDEAVISAVQNRIAELQNETSADLDDAMETLREYNEDIGATLAAGITKRIGGKVYAYQSGNKGNDSED